MVDRDIGPISKLCFIYIVFFSSQRVVKQDY